MRADKYDIPVGDPFGGPAYGRREDPATIMLAVTVAGAASSAIGAIKQGQRDSNMATYNAQVATRDAGVATAQANADAAAQQRHATQVIGAARAGYGASGITTEGSPLDVLVSSAANAELDKQNILYKGELRATGYNDTAKLDTYRGDAALQAGYEKAGSAILMGAGKAYGAMPGSKPATTGYQVGDYSSIDMGV